MSTASADDERKPSRPAIIPYGSRTEREDAQKKRMQARARILSGSEGQSDGRTEKEQAEDAKPSEGTASPDGGHASAHAPASRGEGRRKTVRSAGGRRKSVLQGGLRPAMSSEASPADEGESPAMDVTGHTHTDGGSSSDEPHPADVGADDARQHQRLRPRLSMPSMPSLPAAPAVSMPAVRSDHTAAGDPGTVPVDDAAPDPVTRGRFDYPTPEETALRQAEDQPDAEDMTVDAVLNLCVDMGASDVFIKPDSPVWYQVNGITFPSERFRRMDKERMETMARDLITSQLGDKFTRHLELDTSYVIDDDGPHQGSRFRLSMIRSDNNGVEMVFRYISPRIETPQTLGLSDDVMDWINLPRGLILVCGPTGSGKSTSLASMIRVMQTTQRRHIITVEDPVETVYPRDGLSLVDQREVGVDTLSFENSLTSAMREAPDVILVGEMRTREEIDATLQAADSGHLTFSTLHTKSAEETIQRIASRFSGEDRRDVLDRLASNLAGVLSQQLLQRADGEGRVAVHEVMHVDRGTAALIREGNVSGIRDIMEERKASMDHELVRMMRDGVITRDEARFHAVDLQEFGRIERGEDDAENQGDDDAGNADGKKRNTAGRLRMAPGRRHVSPLASSSR